MMVRPLLAVSLVLILLAGCTGSDLGGSDSASTAGIPSGVPPSGEGSGASGNHRDPVRSESGITIKQDGNKIVASKTVTIVNDFGAASQSTVALKTVVGGVSARAWSSGGYKAVILLESRADSESVARSGLDKLTVVHGDHLNSGTLALDTHVDFPDQTCPNGGPCLSAGITENLPSTPAYRFTLNAVTGGATVAGLGGPAVDASTTTGGIDISGSFARIAAQVTTGGIALDGVANSVDATTTTGGVKVFLEAKGSGTWNLKASTGGVEAQVGRSGGQGVDADAQTQTGGVNIALGASHEVGAQSRTHAHLQTDGFDQATVQLKIHATTQTGGVTIQQAI